MPVSSAQFVNMLSSKEFCGVCLSTEIGYDIVFGNICTEDDNTTIEDYVNLKTILEDIFHNEASRCIVSNYLCQECVVKAMQSYKFKKTARETSNILECYVNQTNNKVDDVINIIAGKYQYENTIIILNDLEDSHVTKEYYKIETKEDIQIESNMDVTPVTEDNFNLEFKQNIKIESDLLDYNSDSSLNTQYLDNMEEDIKPVEDEKRKYNRQMRYICDICDEKFSCKKNIIEHIQFAHQGKRRVKYECLECLVPSCKHARYLKAYKKARIQKLSYTPCADCGVPCSTKQSLILHVNKIHMKNEKWDCPICSQTLNSKLAYMQHLYNYHNEKLSCQYCDREFLKLDNLENHRKICKNTKNEYRCDLSNCPASFKTLRRLNNHKARKHSKVFNCHLCSKKFLLESRLQSHLEMHTNPEMNHRKYMCPACDMVFPEVKQRLYHIYCTHTKFDKYVCPKCNFETDSVSKFSEHGHSINENNCLVPIKRVQTRRSIFFCDMCNYHCNSSQCLISHKNGRHLKIRPYECIVCKKGFLSESRMKQHAKLHENTKYECHICSQLLGSAVGLKKHVRLHTGEKPYICEKCGECFLSSDRRKKHLVKVHCSDQKIKCPLCTSNFLFNVELRRHVRKVHWKLDEPFDLTKIPGLTPAHYEMLRDKRLAC